MYLNPFCELQVPVASRMVSEDLGRVTKLTDLLASARLSRPPFVWVNPHGSFAAKSKSVTTVTSTKHHLPPQTYF